VPFSDGPQSRKRWVPPLQGGWDCGIAYLALKRYSNIALPGRAPHGAASSVLSVFRCMNRILYHPGKAADRAPGACVSAECPVRGAKSFFRPAGSPADGSPAPANVATRPARVAKGSARHKKRAAAYEKCSSRLMPAPAGQEKCPAERSPAPAGHSECVPRLSPAPARQKKCISRLPPAPARPTERVATHEKSKYRYGVRRAQRCAMIPKPLARASAARSAAS